MLIPKVIAVLFIFGGFLAILCYFTMQTVSDDLQWPELLFVAISFLIYIVINHLSFRNIYSHKALALIEALLFLSIMAVYCGNILANKKIAEWCNR